MLNADIFWTYFLWYWVNFHCMLQMAKFLTKISSNPVTLLTNNSDNCAALPFRTSTKAFNCWKQVFVCFFFEAKMQLQPVWPEWAIFVTSRRQILLTKVAQLFGDFLGKFETITFYLKTAVSTFWGNFVKIWSTFYSNIWSHWLQRQQSICQQLL